MARITLPQLLDQAAEHGYGVPAFNINNMEQGLAIMEAAAATAAAHRRGIDRRFLMSLRGNDPEAATRRGRYSGLHCIRSL